MTLDPGERPAWHAAATCRGSVGARRLLFAVNEPDQLDGIAAYCTRCPVIADCLEHALATNELEGVWGGRTPRQRRRMRRLRSYLPAVRRDPEPAAP